MCEIAIDQLAEKLGAERARIVATLRAFADRLAAMPPAKACDALRWSRRPSRTSRAACGRSWRGSLAGVA
jgi:hypothetical protein